MRLFNSPSLYTSAPSRNEKCRRTKFVFLLIFFVAYVSLTDGQAATTPAPPGCQSINQVNNAQNPPGGGSCNVTDSVLRVQCTGGYCQTYSWSLNSCTQSCQNGGTGPSNSSLYICPTTCQTVSSASMCSSPPAITQYACGSTTSGSTTTVTSTTLTTTLTTASTSTPTTTVSPTTTSTVTTTTLTSTSTPTTTVTPTTTSTPTTPTSTSTVTSTPTTTIPTSTSTITTLPTTTDSSSASTSTSTVSTMPTTTDSTITSTSSSSSSTPSTVITTPSSVTSSVATDATSSTTSTVLSSASTTGLSSTVGTETSASTTISTGTTGTTGTESTTTTTTPGSTAGSTTTTPGSTASTASGTMSTGVSSSTSVTVPLSTISTLSTTGTTPTGTSQPSTGTSGSSPSSVSELTTTMTSGATSVVTGSSMTATDSTTSAATVTQSSSGPTSTGTGSSATSMTTGTGSNPTSMSTAATDTSSVVQTTTSTSTVPSGSTPTVTVQTGSSTSPTIATGSTTSPTIATASITSSTALTGSTTVPTVQTGSTVTQTVQTGTTVTQTVQTGSTVTPTVQTGSTVTQTVQTGSTVTPTVQTGSTVTPTVQTGSTVTPTVQTGSTVTPTVQTGSTVTPTVQTGSTVTPTVQTGSTVTPAVQTGSTVTPTVQTGSSTIQTGSTTSSTVQTGSTMSSTIQTGSTLTQTAVTGSSIQTVQTGGTSTTIAGGTVATLPTSIQTSCTTSSTLLSTSSTASPSSLSTTITGTPSSLSTTLTGTVTTVMTPTTASSTTVITPVTGTITSGTSPTTITGTMTSTSVPTATGTSTTATLPSSSTSALTGTLPSSTYPTGSILTSTQTGTLATGSTSKPATATTGTGTATSGSPGTFTGSTTKGGSSATAPTGSVPSVTVTQPTGSLPSVSSTKNSNPTSVGTVTTGGTSGSKATGTTPTGASAGTVTIGTGTNPTTVKGPTAGTVPSGGTAPTGTGSTIKPVTTVYANCSIARLEDNLKPNFCNSTMGLDCGNGQCIDYNGPKRLNCINDCANGVDERCFDGQIKCTTSSGCACVNASDISKCTNVLSVTMYPNCTTTSKPTGTPGTVGSSVTTKVTTAGTVVTVGTGTNPTTAKGPSAGTAGTAPPTTATVMPTIQPAVNCTICRGPTCVCPDGYIGDGYDCVVDQCDTKTCAENEICQGSWSKSNCQFRSSFVCVCDPNIGCAPPAPPSPAPTILPTAPPTTATPTVRPSSPLTLPPTSMAIPPIPPSTIMVTPPRPPSPSTPPPVYPPTDSGGNLLTYKPTSGPSLATPPPPQSTAAPSIPTTPLPPATHPPTDSAGNILTFKPSTTTTTVMPSVKPAVNCTVCKGSNCVCPDGQIGDGLDCVIDQCDTKTCAENEMCQGSWSKSNCQFRSSFICVCDPNIGCTPPAPPSPPPTDGAGNVVTKRPSTTITIPTPPPSTVTTKPTPPPSTVTTNNKPTVGSNPAVTGTSTQTVLPTVMPAKNCTVCKTCSCPDGYIGDGLDCVLDQCATKVCAWNEYCQGYWSKSKCLFSVTFACLCDPDIGCGPITIPDDVIFGNVSLKKTTTTTTMAPSTKSSSTSTTLKTTFTTVMPTVQPAKNCSVCKNGSNCVCADGFIGDGIDCIVDQCAAMTCAWNEYCEGLWWKSNCQFKSVFQCTCDPDIGCTTDPPPTAADIVITGYVSRRQTTTTTTKMSTTASTSTTTTSTTTATTTAKPTTVSTPKMTTSMPKVTTSQCVTRTIMDAVVQGGCGFKDNVSRIVCGDGTCVPFESTYMDCKRDCSDGIDEQCAPGYVLCDGCTCVAPEDVRLACTDFSSISTIVPCAQTQYPASGYVSVRKSPTAAPTTMLIQTYTPKVKNNCTICSGGPTCVCPSGFVGDGITCVPDQCANMTCAWNEYCEGMWYKSQTCQFTTTFQCLCDPDIGCGQIPAGGTVIVKGTQSTTKIPASRPTMAPDKCNMCRGNNCSCPAGFLGDGIDCVPDKCETMTCAYNEMCEGFWYKSANCIFNTTFRCVCDPEIGCDAVATTPAQPVVCNSNEFLCRTGHRKCISCAWVEDKVNDCDNGEDEVAGAAYQSRCVGTTAASQYPAMGIITHKPVKTTPGAIGGVSTVRAACGSSFYTCKADGQCVPCPWVNDTVKDCKDGDDETSAAVIVCSGSSANTKIPVMPVVTQSPGCGNNYWTCPSNGQCIPCSWVDDKISDCQNGEDETSQAIQFCKGAAPVTIPTMRPLDTCRDGKTTCPANSQCVNKVDGSYYCVCNTNYYDSNGQCLIHPCYDPNKAACDPHAWCDPGNATTLTSAYTCHCIMPYTGDGKTCPQQQGTAKPSCTSDQFQCPSDGNCVPMAWVLDNVRDCPNGDDEQPALIDECKVHKAFCDSHATCANIPNGGYNCTCQLPYYGNGFSCWQPSPNGNIIQRARRFARMKKTYQDY